MNDRPEPPAGEPGPPRSALDWADHPGRAGRLVAELRQRQRRRATRRWAAAGVAACALLIAGLALPRLREAPPPAAAPVVHFPERQVLPDGTRVDLRPGARIATDYSSAFRRVTLLAGEAHFAVTPDATRPFIVQARGVEVRAVGTAFAVQLAPSGLAVLVTEGRVALDTSATPAAPERRTFATLDAGNQARIAAAATPRDPVAAIAPVAPAEIAAQLAWRAPRLEFTATPLADAVALFNRHSTTRLVLGDPQLGALQISGIVRADHPDPLIQLLEANYPVVALAAGDTIRLVSRRR